MRTLNIVHTDKGTRKSVDLLDFCILESKAALVLDIRDDREISDMKLLAVQGQPFIIS